MKHNLTYEIYEYTHRALLGQTVNNFFFYSQEGETWIENCTKATCLGNNNIVISKVECPPVQNIVCENGYPPVKVLSKDGCCYHYECECKFKCYFSMALW